MPGHLHAIGYTGKGFIRGEAIIPRTKAPGVEYEALVLYHAAGVRAVVVYTKDGGVWSAPVEKLLSGEVVKKTKRSIPRGQWTITPSPTQSLF